MRTLSDEDVEAIAQRVAELLRPRARVKRPAQREPRRAGIDLEQLNGDQKRLYWLMAKYCNRSQAELSRRIDRDPAYISRLFKPENDTNHVGLGSNLKDACIVAFGLRPTFWGDRIPKLPA